MRDHLRARIAGLPLTSGVYLMKDSAGTVIYIGKAVNLRRRVQSYFRGRTDNVRTALLVENIADIDFIQTHSEAEALVLEAALVKQHLPKYNVELKDGKSYPYICISDAPFPLVSIVRLPSGTAGETPGGRLFGPYTDAALIREALTLIRKIFPFRSCEPMPGSACLYHDIGLCQAPCLGQVSAEEYARAIRHIARILDGKKDDLYRELRLEMEEFARAKNFEEAARTRDRMRAVGALYSSSPDVNCFKEAEQLQRALGLARPPERLECFDISNTMGTFSVGSMVSFLNGTPDKSNYRRFRIKTVEGIDDFRMIAEVVRRRYSRLKKEGRAYPDLVVIDGGKGQLQAAAGELRALGLDIPLIGLAKREEEIFVPGKRAALVLSRDSLALRLLQRLRDEAHRFAVSYHRLLRDKSLFSGKSPV